MKIAFTALLLLPALANAQSIEIKGDQVEITAPGTHISTSAAGASVSAGTTRIDSRDASANVTTDAAKVRAGANGSTTVRATSKAAPGTSSVQTTTKRDATGNHSVTTVVTGNAVNHASGGATSVQSIGEETVVETDTGDSVTTTHVSTRNGVQIRSTASTTSAQGSSEVSYVNGELDGTNFSGRKLASVAFTNASLIAADFRNADLQGADLTNADFTRAQLQGANLRHADITNTEFSDAVLDGALWVDGRTCGSNSRGVCR
ncbi:pentapeptide repeat-containing protein [Tahibacter amnicola]|uniref:Pentapeptide repeat-containing protein n=1 Tax=Tahibacter amnicola TaxID=2976241 RepID=A0ABY6BD02_9GAMM|nr:pentapeptide repeat-containing protein [Tahibacter amnicola]UXI65787.1 pentapeptide repeat-containing protein [Tahibacter amnicola]